MKLKLYMILILAATIVGASPEQLIFRVTLPIKKSKEDKVREVLYDIWGPVADQWGKVKNMSPTNWADFGWEYTTNSIGVTSAWYRITCEQNLFRATPEKKNEWKNLINGGVDCEIFSTNVYIQKIWSERGEKQIEEP